MTETKIADLVGLTEIADMYGVSKDVANGWRRAKAFPSIKHQLAMGPMWDRNEVIAWRSPKPDYRLKSTDLPCSSCGGKLTDNPTSISNPGCGLVISLRCQCGEVTDLVLYIDREDGASICTEGWEAPK